MRVICKLIINVYGISLIYTTAVDQILNTYTEIKMLSLNGAINQEGKRIVLLINGVLYSSYIL